MQGVGGSSPLVFTIYILLDISNLFDIIFIASGCGAVGSALDWGSRGRKFKSCHSDQKIRQVSTCRIFLSKPQAWHIITARSVVHIISPFGAVSHHALACIYLRLDDIQHFVLVICNSCGIDDIHGYAVILRLSSKPYYKTQKYLF